MPQPARSSPRSRRKPARASEDEPLRSVLTAVFVAALVAAPAQSKAAPRNIGDCEKIQAADAYNQCLALFGPLALGHGAIGNRAWRSVTVTCCQLSSGDVIGDLLRFVRVIDRG